MKLVRSVREDYKTRKFRMKEIELGWCDRDKEIDVDGIFNRMEIWDK
jgi:hypothetical protein